MFRILHNTKFDFVRQWKLAIDVGGHIGIFSRGFEMTAFISFRMCSRPSRACESAMDGMPTCTPAMAPAAIVAAIDPRPGQQLIEIGPGLGALTAPLARALVGKTVGDTVEVSTPKGEKSYEILKVRFV